MVPQTIICSYPPEWKGVEYAEDFSMRSLSLDVSLGIVVNSNNIIPHMTARATFVTRIINKFKKRV